MAKKTDKGRGRLSAIDLLPPECDALIAKAAQLLAAREHTQAEIFARFEADCRVVQKEMGRIFAIPSRSAFNRYSIRLAAMSRRLSQTREIAASLADRFDAGASDDLTLIAAEAIKTLIFETLSGNERLEPKEAQALGNALKSALAAQHISTARRQKLEAEFAKDAGQAVEQAAKEAGLSGDMAAAIRNQVLGVRNKPEPRNGK
ncbi:DUF3486 family protein [Candidatus Tokpelaia sp.]|uniref:DUF3486 family protein n=1 Tax=Candidatus Tokpelaia sp. TaxID=2233777 RepID=UPI0012384A25|nr:hypothetical protein DPQ22_03065 [Candidatus Tokpelaia sp.]